MARCCCRLEQRGSACPRPVAAPAQAQSAEGVVCQPSQSTQGCLASSAFGKYTRHCRGKCRGLAQLFRHPLPGRASHLSVKVQSGGIFFFFFLIKVAKCWTGRSNTPAVFFPRCGCPCPFSRVITRLFEREVMHPVTFRRKAPVCRKARIT